MRGPSAAAGRTPAGPGRIVLDAQGGDAPEEVVAGALAAAREGLTIALAGPEAALRAHGLPVLDAPDVVAMDEEPAIALRAKPDASVRVAARALAAGTHDVLVSAGATGATVAAALLELGRLPGVRRPVVAARIPLPGDRHVVLLDAGGSSTAQARDLVVGAALGRAYARALGTTDPRIGLLNVGTEAGKGTALTREVEALLAVRADFAGNVEPSHVLAGAVDVVVTDGFTGNIFLKAVEAAAGGADGDHAALLLGVRGTVLVAHGAATADQVAHALALADRIHRGDLVGAIASELAADHLTTA